MKIIQAPDLSRLLAFEKASWPQDLQASEAELAKRLEAFPQGIFLLAVDAKDVVQITVSPKQLPPAKDITSFEKMRDLPVDLASKDLWVTNIAAKQGQEYRGKGYATVLMSRVVSWAIENGYNSILAGVTCSGFANARAQGQIVSIQEYLDQGMNPALRVFQKAANQNNCQHQHTGPLKDYWLNDQGSEGYGVLISINLKAGN